MLDATEKRMLGAVINTLQTSHVQLTEAIAHMASHHPLDLMSAKEIQAHLRAILGEKHRHKRSIGSDQCDICMRDLRDECHVRS